MKTVAVVPMKLNNSRLKNKNTKSFTNGLPLCSYILNTLNEISSIDEIIADSIFNHQKDKEMK